VSYCEKKTLSTIDDVVTRIPKEMQLCHSWSKSV